MIYPGDFKVFHEKPEFKLSWAVLILNVIIFVGINLTFDSWPSADLRQKLVDQKFIKSVNEMYLQSLDPIQKKNIKDYSDYSIYRLALKDRTFWGKANDFPFSGDRIRIAENRKMITSFYETYEQSPHHYFGLGSLEISPWSWMTYQFVHVSFMHLLGNVILIFLLVSYLEKTVSLGWIASVYLLSGFAGGISFLYFDNISGVSVIGASASASGLMSFLLVTQITKLMPWGYLIAPVKNGFGQIYLPVFFIFPIFLISDLIALLWEPTGVVSNVAISAHVGGSFMGAILGVYYLLFLRSEASAHRVFSYNDGFNELT